MAFRVTIVWGTATSFLGYSVAAQFFILDKQHRDSRGVGPTAENSLLKIFQCSVYALQLVVAVSCTNTSLCGLV